MKPGFTYKIVPLGLLVILFSGLGILVFFPREPTYQGKPLRVWLAQINDVKSEKETQARRAISQMGAAAVPWLIEELRATDSAWKWKVESWAQRYGHIKIHFTDATTRRLRACQACSLLGPEAKAAIPELVKLINEPRISYPDRYAFALAKMGPEAIPPLIQSLGNTNAWGRLFLPIALLLSGDKSDAVVTALIAVVREPQVLPNVQTQETAIRALREIGRRSDLVVPALMAMLRDGMTTITNQNVRFTAMSTLAHPVFRAEAHAAIPVLFKMIEEKDEGQHAAVDALSQILE